VYGNAPAGQLLTAMSVVVWILSIAVFVWILAAIRDIRNSLRKLVQSQDEMLLLHREWHHLAQRMWANEPPTPSSTEKPSD
jgi:hypothetical protein